AEAARLMRKAEDMFRAVRVLEGWEQNNVRMMQVFALSTAGMVADLAPRYARWITDAEARGDRYAATVLRRRSSILWLSRGDVAGALDALEHARWDPPEGRYHLQHWYEVQARAEAALVAGTGADHARAVDDALVRMHAAKIDRVQMVRVPALWLSA